MINRITTLLICLASACVFAQTPGVRLSFEVASVKPNTSNSTNSLTSFNRGRFVATNVSVKQLLMSAYRVQDFQIIGGPGWIESDGFDIEAKPEEGAIPQQQGPRDPTAIDSMSLMLQSLLADRFEMKLHRETRELPVYNLSVGKDGPKFKAADPSQQSAPATAPSTTGTGRAPLPPGNMGTSVNNGRGEMNAHAVPMMRLINFLSQQLRRPVIDKTDLKDFYDFHVEWTRDQNAGAAASTAGGAPPPATLDAPSGPSIFTAVQEQLGLKLDSGKGPVEVLVIDDAQKPAAN
jgi:uncharacterized protein (TIGR03435 family)